jgi:predicted TIM-barrel fold metal-dependent hydrolase
MGRKKYEVVSADVHILEPRDIWEKHLPKKYADHAPKLVKDHEGGDAWQFSVGAPDPIGLVSTPGRRFEEFRWFGVTYEETRPGCWDGKERLRDMDIDGVDAEVIFPPQRTMGHWLSMPDEEVSMAGIDAYNEFIFDEFAAADPDRLIPCYQMPNLGVDTALKYLDKAIKKKAKTVVISSWPSGGENISPDDDRFWQACVDANMPVNIHISLMSRASGVKSYESGQKVTSGVGKGAGAANQRAVGAMSGVFTRTTPVLVGFILSGALDRIPDLQIVLTEIGVGWVPHFIEQIDDRFWRNRGWGEIDIKEPPSYYWHKNFAATFMIDFSGIYQRHLVGVKNMMWSTDYPHHGNDWPYSRKTIGEQFTGVDGADRYDMLAGNAVRIFKLPETAK